jgi:TonB family protein
MTLLIDAITRPSIVLLVGLAVSILPGRRSAALRHAVLACAILGGALVVPFGQLLPGWDIPVRESETPEAAAPRSTVVSESFAASVRSSRLSPIVRLSVPIVWSLGAGVALGALVTGVVRIRRLSTRADPVLGGRWRQIATEVATQYDLERPITLLQTSGTPLLATWGVFRPRVLLPSEARPWSDERVRVVLSHELAHVRRGDWAVQVTAEILRAIYWFNPFLWLACAELRRQSERACDDAVLRTGIGPRKYAGHLIDIARTCRWPEAAGARATPMARRSALRGRIAAMLNPDLNRDAVSPRAVVLAVLTLLAVTVPVAGFRVEQDSPRTLSGAVYDPSGAALPQVELTLEDAQHAKMQTITDGTGHFEFAPVPPGDYVIHASLQGFRPLRYELTLAHERDWRQHITLQVGEVHEEINVRASRATATPRPEGPAPLKIGGNVRPPKKVRDVRPVYPSSMKEAGIEGTVPLDAVIGRDGSVSSVRVASATVHPDLAIAAIDAVRQWKFEPTLLNGAPVEVMMTVTIDFRLD